MEDVVRIHLGDAFLFDAKNSFAHDTLPIGKSFEGVKPFCRNLLSSHGRLSTPGNTSTNFVETIEEESGEERSTSQAEIIRIHDVESDSHKIRPSTADVNTNKFMSPARIGRGESAPTLFKRSKSREKRSQMRKKKIDGDKESLDSHSIDDEIDDILSGSFSSISNSIGSNKHRSAKSRDSGFLGESGNFEADSKLDVLNLP
uniref:Uncharacterized protein n=1 Tax=Panagrolaimus superbus TaxID=310955 RepID=A0A914Y5C5_9BILA